MFTLLIAILIGVSVLVASEVVRRRLRISNEDSRKTYHVVHALIIAGAPFLVSYEVIIALELVLLVSMILVKKFQLFEWLYKVGRISWGEYFGVVGIILIAYIQPNTWVFVAALLHLGIADALAAVIGKRFGRKHQFKVFGQAKSVLGSSTFFVTSVLITALVLAASNSTSSHIVLLLILPLLTTAAEMVSPFGSDNLIIPVLVVAVLQTLQFSP